MGGYLPDKYYKENLYNYIIVANSLLTKNIVKDFKKGFV